MSEAEREDAAVAAAMDHDAAAKAVEAAAAQPEPENRELSPDEQLLEQRERELRKRVADEEASVDCPYRIVYDEIVRLRAARDPNGVIDAILDFCNERTVAHRPYIAERS